MDFAQILRKHWGAFVRAAEGPIPSRAWAAVEAVLSCRTPRRGGRLHHCLSCRRSHFLYHSCNHRACPRCGGRDAALWSRRQEARLLPVPYYLLTITVPAELRPAFLLFPSELFPAFFAAKAAALKSLCASPKHLGGQPAFVSILHTWTRRLFFHPHIHSLIPAVGLSDTGSFLHHPRYEDYLVPHKALARATRDALRSLLAAHHPELFLRIPSAVWHIDWVAQCQHAGRGRSALRYLAAYVKKTAFHQDRLEGFDAHRRIILRYRDSADNALKRETLTPHELIRRWLLHVLPKGLVRVRHYGWLSPAAHKALHRVRFLLGLGPCRLPPAEPSEPPRCPCCQGPLAFLASIGPVRGPPLSRLVLAL